MRRPTRATAAGQAYLDLQNRARAEGRATQELLTLYVVERWLARLSMSPYADQAAVVERVIEIAHQTLADDDGVEYRADTVSSRIIRDEALYSGVRIAMDCAIATAVVKFRLDVNFGDPVTPAPRHLSLPSLRPGMPPVRVLGYPIETVLAEKITTAIGLGPANTRVRDYADVYTLTRNWSVDHGTAHKALLATAAFRGTTLAALSSAVDNLADLRQQTYAAYRASLGIAGEDLPANFSEVVEAVIAFADALASEASAGTTWSPQQRQWKRTDL